MIIIEILIAAAAACALFVGLPMLFSWAIEKDLDSRYGKGD